MSEKSGGSSSSVNCGSGIGLSLLFLGFWGEPDLIDSLIAFLQSFT